LLAAGHGGNTRSEDAATGGDVGGYGETPAASGRRAAMNYSMNYKQSSADSDGRAATGGILCLPPVLLF
jgi:hypothetical protein